MAGYGILQRKTHQEVRGAEMKKDTKEMEDYLEAHADELVDSIEEDAKLVRHAKEDVKARKARAAGLQKLRKDKLKLSQSQLAQAVGANVRTLQSWETGRQDYPKSVEILMTLMNHGPVSSSFDT